MTGSRAPWSLRRRLIAVVGAVLLVLVVVIGTVSVVVLERSLEQRLDEQVRAGLVFGEGADGDGDDEGGPERRAGALAGVVADGRVTQAAFVDDDGRVIALDADQLATLSALPVDGVVREVDLGEGLGQFRVVLDETREGRAALSGLSTVELRATIATLVTIVAVVGLGALVAAAAVSAVLIRRSLDPLARVADTATRMAARPMADGEVELSERVPAGLADDRTEVGAVGAALNTLLGRVEGALQQRERSEQRLRRFIADASHELRTPLASVRGHAELTRRDDAALSDQQRRSLGRIEQEAVRMSALVDDLLLLARLDAGQPLRRERVDLAAILVDAVSDAHAAAPERDWALEVPESAVEVEGDPHRLQQVVANLLANARTHTPPGTAVVASVGAVKGEAVIRVDDAGPGIEPALRDTLFERFVRGDSSRSRESGSSGLGLSIVAAIVQAHGGAVRADRSPQGGARIEVRVPLAPVL